MDEKRPEESTCRSDEIMELRGLLQMYAELIRLDLLEDDEGYPYDLA